MYTSTWKIWTEFSKIVSTEFHCFFLSFFLSFHSIHFTSLLIEPPPPPHSRQNNNKLAFNTNSSLLGLLCRVFVWVVFLDVSNEPVAFVFKVQVVILTSILLNQSDERTSNFARNRIIWNEVSKSFDCSYCALLLFIVIVSLKPPIDQHNTHNQTPTDHNSGNTHTLMGKAAKHSPTLNQCEKCTDRFI
jgi:hypothetical protein